MTEKKRTVLQVRTSEEDVRAWKAAAKARGISTSEWVRKILNYALEKERAS
jgi:predicted DNA binding CopG/RHH family protein